MLIKWQKAKTKIRERGGSVLYHVKKRWNAVEIEFSEWLSQLERETYVYIIWKESREIFSMGFGIITSLFSPKNICRCFFKRYFEDILIGSGVDDISIYGVSTTLAVNSAGSLPSFLQAFAYSWQLHISLLSLKVRI